MYRVSARYTTYYSHIHIYIVYVCVHIIYMYIYSYYIYKCIFFLVPDTHYITPHPQTNICAIVHNIYTLCSDRVLEDDLSHTQKNKNTHTHTHTHTHIHKLFRLICVWCDMGWLRLAGSLKL